jgi:1D-myo-inositol-tetrakisphosphate 5-kinase/inositol-polyphosphate multikinase
MHGFRRFTPCSEEDPKIHTDSELTPRPPAGLPAQVLLSTLESILADIKAFYDVVKDYEWRVAGGSLLIAYEGSEVAQPGYKVRMIDFAHARYLPGHGPDEGLLKGTQSVIRLLDSRIAELQATMMSTRA